jgi:hypothetical protein
VSAGIAVAAMVAAFPIEAVVAALLGGGKIGGAVLGGLLGGAMLAYASLPVIATVTLLGSLPFLRPRFGPIATGLYVALCGTAVGGVFAGTLYRGSQPWQTMLVGPGLWFWIIAAVVGFLTLWVRRDRAGALSAAVAAACIVVLNISAVSIAHRSRPAVSYRTPSRAGEQCLRSDRQLPPGSEPLCIALSDEHIGPSRRVGAGRAAI